MMMMMREGISFSCFGGKAVRFPPPHLLFQYQQHKEDEHSARARVVDTHSERLSGRQAKARR